MNLRQLLEKNADQFDRVFTRLVDMYPGDDDEISFQNYAKVFTALTNVPEEAVKPSEMSIAVQRFLDREMGDVLYDVCVIDGQGQEHPLNDFPWREWLGMDVTGAVNMWGEIDSLAHILFEISYVGIDEAGIENEWDEIKKLLDSVRHYGWSRNYRKG